LLGLIIWLAFCRLRPPALPLPRLKFILKAARNDFSEPEPAAFHLYDDCA
jgi:hypothetical protein